MKALRTAGNYCLRPANNGQNIASVVKMWNSLVEPRVGRRKLRMFDAGSADQSALAAFSGIAGIFKFPSNSFRLFRTLASSYNETKRPLFTGDKVGLKL